MNDIYVWLEQNIKYGEIQKGLNTALKFYGKEMQAALFDYNLELSLNDRKSYGNRKAGCFYPDSYRIELFSVTENIKNLDVVFVHELAHFLDRINRPKANRHKYASSVFGSAERIVAETFRRRMKPFPQKRTNYRGRTCELFARALEEYYAIKTNCDSMLSLYDGWDYYVNVKTFEKAIMPVVSNYFTNK